MQDKQLSATNLEGLPALVWPSHERAQLLSLSTSGVHQARTLRGSAVAIGQFLLHFLEMAIAMMVGMAFFAPVKAALVDQGYIALLDRTSLDYQVWMNLFMIVPMVLWMRVRGGSWREGAEMAAAMVVLPACVLALCSIGVTDVLSWFTPNLSAPAMLLGMVGIMLYRREMYTSGYSLPWILPAATARGAQPTATTVRPPRQQPAIERQQEIQKTDEEHARLWWPYVLWIAGACVWTFAISAFFAGVLQLPRVLFLVPYVTLTLAFLYAYARWSRVSLRRAALHNWSWGLIGAVVVGVFGVNDVLRQPASSAPVGLELVGALLWLGVVYGAVDALLLSIFPMLATWQGCSALGWTNNWPGRVLTGILAIVASVLVTAAYHVGYPEYRSPHIAGAIVGNSVATLASLLTMSPIAAVFSHIAMHIAAVLHGVETVAQLPPHYPV
jgi:hypothetical protein